MSNTPLGRVCWFELMTDDVSGATEFYPKISKWKSEPWPGPEPYMTWMTDSGPIGGVYERTPEQREMGVPECWTMYVSTPDIAATAAKAKELGGSVMNESIVEGAAKIAIIRDPQGAVFGLMQPEGETPGHDDPPRVGEFSWIELPATDWRGARDFYLPLFGWKEHSRMEMGERGTYFMFSRGAHPLGGMMNHPPGVFPGWWFYIRVGDVKEAVSVVEEAGGEVFTPPMEVPGGDWIAHCKDPKGAAFALHQAGAAQPAS